MTDNHSGPFLRSETDRGSNAFTRRQSRRTKLLILINECSVQAREAERAGRTEDIAEWLDLHSRLEKL